MAEGTLHVGQVVEYGDPKAPMFRGKILTVRDGADRITIMVQRIGTELVEFVSYPKDGSRAPITAAVLAQAVAAGRPVRLPVHAQLRNLAEAVRTGAGR